MRVYREIDDYIPVPNAVATIGTFDGLHIGHQVIISRVKKLTTEAGGESVIITFSPHPQIVLHPEEKNIFVLNTEKEKIKLLEKQGIGHLIIIPFTHDFASVPYFDFIKNILIDKLHVRKLVIGYDHHYGNNRQGEFRHLADYGKQYDFEVEEIAAQKVGEVAVSSTKIRKALMSGDIRLANKFLGYNYSLCGKVVKGDGIGKTLGFPTANIKISDKYKLIPAQGIYAVEIEYGLEKYSGMASIGTRPTFGGNKLVIEVNIFNFDKNIYSENLNVNFIERFRDEIKFPDIEQLKKQLVIDKQIAEKILKK